MFDLVGSINCHYNNQKDYILVGKEMKGDVEYDIEEWNIKVRSIYIGLNQTNSDDYKG